MPPRSSSTTVLIIPLILSMFRPPPTRDMASAAETGYCAATDQPYSSNLLCGSPTGYLPSLAPVEGNSISLFSGKNITASSSILPLPPATLQRENQTMSSSWPLEEGICGAPSAAQLVYSHHPFFGSNESSHVNSVLFPEIQIKQTYEHPLERNFCTSYRIDSPQSIDPWVRVQLIALCNEYYIPKPDIYSSFSAGFADDVVYAFADGINEFAAEASQRHSHVSRKMLRGNGSTMIGNLHPQIPRRLVLDRKKHILPPSRYRVRIPLWNIDQGVLLTTIGSALLGVLCTIAALLLWCNRNRKCEAEKPSSIIGQTQLCPSAPRWYSHSELAVATQEFADEAKIGGGGFGPVYRGYLGGENRHVAIKMLSSQGSSVQGAREFEAEVRVMTRLRHRNIVELVGWCDDGPNRDLLLVYEFVPNGSLDKHLHDPQRVLTWSDRYKIALGVGSAILYLHAECEQCIVHGDIKPANILLDASYNAKLGDFGLARFVDHDADPRTTQVVAGTLGYIDPEFVNTQRPSAESDVYSFGVALLEMACGRRPTTSTQQSSRTPALVNWVRHMHRQTSILGAADRRLDGEFDEQQMKRVLIAGLWCTLQDQSQRPTIAQAMDVLRREGAEMPVFGPEIQTDDAVRSLEETAYGDLSGEETPCEESPAETEYHTSVLWNPLIC